MASSREYLEYILEQLSGLDEMHDGGIYHLLQGQDRRRHI